MDGPSAQLAQAVAAGVLLAAAAPAAAQEVLIRLAPAPIVHMYADGGGSVYGVTGLGYVYRIGIDGSEVTFDRVGTQQRLLRPRGVLDGGVVTMGGANIRAAWLAFPTYRYDHGALGDRIEAGGLRLSLSGGGTVSFFLSEQYVFEDTAVRLVDLNGDGADELLVVRTDVDRGAGLALYDVIDGEVRLAAASAPIGQRYRWLNPVGAADFDGDGVVEIAAVVTPHLDGLLTWYRRDGSALVPVAEAPGHANHVLGSPEIRQSAIVDVDGDGIDDIVLPALGSRTVRAVSFAGGKVRILAEFAHDSAVVGAFVRGVWDGVPGVAYSLADARLIVVRFPGATASSP